MSKLPVPLVRQYETSHPEDVMGVVASCGKCAIFLDVDDTLIMPCSQSFLPSNPYRMMIDEIKKNVCERNYRLTFHARARMFERHISNRDLVDLIINGEIIEEYHDDYRCPTVLMLGKTRGIPHHIVVAICKDRLIIVTVYLPNEDEWINSKRRK